MRCIIHQILLWVHIYIGTCFRTINCLCPINIGDLAPLTAEYKPKYFLTAGYISQVTSVCRIKFYQVLVFQNVDPSCVFSLQNVGLSGVFSLQNVHIPMFCLHCTVHIQTHLLSALFTFKRLSSVYCSHSTPLFIVLFIFQCFYLHYIV